MTQREIVTRASDARNVCQREVEILTSRKESFPLYIVVSFVTQRSGAVSFVARRKAAFECAQGKENELVSKVPVVRYYWVNL